MRDDWAYIEAVSLDDATAEDWRLLDRQRIEYAREERAQQALEMLAVQADKPTFGYRVNNYEHCLQAATLAMKDGLDEESIVVALFHDLGFITNNETHGEFSAALLRPYVAERQCWMLERHMYFQAAHCAAHPGVDPDIRERWRGHPHFEFAANWVARYDVPTVDPTLESAPLSVFAPMVQRVFATPKSDLPLPV